jgi:HK97 gp10 family phage protein
MKLEGVPALIKTIKEIGKTLDGDGAAAYTERLKDIAMKPCNVIADEARDMVPVVTGKLKAGIFAAPLKARIGAVVGVRGVRYADWVEYGTVRASAQPFLRPAVLATRPLFTDMMAGDLKSLIDEVAAANAWHAPDAG